MPLKITSKTGEDEFCVESYEANEEQFVQIDFTAAFTNDKAFKNRDDLIKWCHDIGKFGTVIVTKRVDNFDSGRTPRITLACERSEKFRLYKKDLEKKTENPRKSSTKKCDCPFTLKGKKLRGCNQWIVEVECGLYRHPVANYLEGYSYAG
ncbi:hypothetical protein GIB67_037250 [Kingdonia uniflora]|uniref:Uncharacterized protein n=1 Tax=Kingdonia uniflora TaxID=39325 RepID=A0A7J7MS70_9MAGN|nr:hypothetical protein GIB67_037250 [Kingdonia uniflora]